MKNNARGGYSFEDHNITADIGMKVRGITLEDLFVYSFSGLLNIIFDSVNSARSGRKKISITSGDTESLLIEFLNEILFYINNSSWHPSAIEDISIKDNALTAVISGSMEDMDKILNTEIKAATYHDLRINKCDDFLETRIVFDL